MGSKIAAPEEIRDHVQQLVNAIPELIENNVTITVPLPQRHVPGEDGCNWNMASFSGVRDYDHIVRTMVEQARQAYNLPPEETD